MTIRSPWLRRAAPDGSAEYLGMVSYFRLRGWRALPAFALNAARVELQLLRSAGLVGASSGSRLRSLEFWSTTVWENESALQGFVRAQPHAGIMEAMRPAVHRSEFVRWRLAGRDVPPSPAEAEARLWRALDGDG